MTWDGEEIFVIILGALATALTAQVMEYVIQLLTSAPVTKAGPAVVAKFQIARGPLIASNGEYVTPL